MQQCLYKNIDRINEKILAIYEILLVHSIHRKDNLEKSHQNELEELQL